MRILGIDPGLQCTGFGVIDTEGAAMRYVASGTIQTSPKNGALLPERLKTLFKLRADMKNARTATAR